MLAVIATVCALLGIAAGWWVYKLKRATPYEPEVLARAWYYDAAVSWFMGNPGRESFQATSEFDRVVVDGAVNGTATAVRETGRELRKGQTGFVRQYAGYISVGAVLLLGWFVVVRGIL